MSKARELLNVIREDDQEDPSKASPAAGAAKPADPKAQPPKAEADKAPDGGNDYAKIFADGNVVMAKDFDGSEDETNWLMENDIYFHADFDDIEEMHIYHPQDMISGNEVKDGMGGFQAAMKEGDLIKLESVFGFSPQESYILVKKAKASHGL